MCQTLPLIPVFRIVETWGISRLVVSCIPNSSQPHSMITLSNTSQRIILSIQIRFSMVIPFRHERRHWHPVDWHQAGVFSRARVRGPGCCMLCSIKHTSKPRWPLPSLRWNEAGPKVRTRPSQTLLYLLSARRARLERGLFTHLQDPLGVQEPVKLDKFGHEPGPAGLVAGA